MTSSGKRTDSASRVIRASAERIYQSFIDPEAIVVWLPPEGMTGELQAFDPRPGSRYRMILTYTDTAQKAPGKTSDATDVTEGRFVELTPNERVVQQVDFESDDPAFAGTMTMTWALKPVADGTEVTFVCENVPEGIGQADHEAGLLSTLRNLAAFTEPQGR